MLTPYFNLRPLDSTPKVSTRNHITEHTPTLQCVLIQSFDVRTLIRSWQLCPCALLIVIIKVWFCSNNFFSCYSLLYVINKFLTEVLLIFPLINISEQCRVISYAIGELTHVENNIIGRIWAVFHLRRTCCHAPLRKVKRGNGCRLIQHLHFGQRPVTSHVRGSIIRSLLKNTSGKTLRKVNNYFRVVLAC